MLRVLSYNIRYGKRIDEISKWLTTLSPKIDIFCFQEFPYSQLKKFLHTSPFTNYSYEFACNFLFRSEKYSQLTLINAKKVQLLKSKKVDLGLQGIVERTFFKTGGNITGLITKLSFNGKDFLIVNLHLIWFALNRSRRKQIETIIHSLSISKDLNKTPTIILGDFNYSSLTNTNGLERFMAKYHFYNSTKRLKTHKLLMFSTKFTHQIDYVFENKQLVENPKSLDVSYSDHYPIYFELKL